MTEFNKIIEDIHASNYNKSYISSLVIFMNKINDDNLIADYIPSIYDIAKISNDKGFAFEALMLLIDCHNRGYRCSDIYEIIINLYFTPYQKKFEAAYNDNISLLRNYEHIQRKNFPDFNNLINLIMPMLNSGYAGYIKYDKSIKRFELIPTLKLYIAKDVEAGIMPGQRNILCDVYDTEYIVNIINKTHYENNYSFLTPCCLYYQSFEEFSSFLQIVDLSQCISLNRAVFIFGAEDIEKHLLKPEVVINGLLIAQTPEKAEKYQKTLMPIFEKKEKHHQELIRKINEYYSKLTTEKIIEKIKNKSARIGLMVSKWTTALQYYIRDCHEAFKKMGFESEIFCEKDSFCQICGSNVYETVNYLFNFKPDIILVIDHFRWAWPVIPKELVFICWIMDHMPHLFDKNSAAKITNLDLILSLYYSHQSFKKIGYPKEQLMPGPVPANSYIYRKYQLSEEENRQFSCDICIISNSGNAMEALNKNVFDGYKNMPDLEFVKKIKTIYTEIYNIIFDSIYNEKKHYYHDETFKLFKEYFMDRTKIVSQIEEINKLVFRFWGDVITCIYKDTAILWLHEKRYNIKLWGRAWPSHPILKNYAMGVAPNGEIMSKILNASKISIGLTPNVTLHPRVAESLLSECLYMGNDIPQGEDWCSARNYLIPGKEIILFKNKKDLYKKVDYYLENARERESVISCGRKKILETLTYEIIMQKTLDGIVKRLSELT